MIEELIKFFNTLFACVRCQSQCCERHIEKHGNDYIEDKNCFAIKVNRKNSKWKTPPDTPPETPPAIDVKSIIV
jgi:hypothetical protein